MTRTELFQELPAIDYELPEHIREKISTPALVVHQDKVRKNIKQMLSYVGDSVARWRPHLKTTKMPEVWSELLRAGIWRFKVSTTRELAVLCDLAWDQGASEIDVILAYPVTGPSLVRTRMIAERHPGARVSVLVESVAMALDVPSNLDAFLDVNVGMDRTGMPLEDARRCAAEVADAINGGGDRERFRGLHCYEGHVKEADLRERERILHGIYGEVMDLVKSLERGGRRVRELVTSGTPAFRHALSYRPFVEELAAGVHQISPGTVVFHDLTVEASNGDVDLVPAAVLMSRVVSCPAKGRVTLDAGSKSIAAEAGDPAAFCVGRPDWRPLKCSEEHMPVLLPEGAQPPARGTMVALVPRHICPTVNLAEEALFVEDGESSVKAFRVVPVLARGREMLLSKESMYHPHPCGFGEEGVGSKLQLGKKQRIS